MFEGMDQQSRQYHTYRLKVGPTGIVTEERSKEPKHAPVMRHGKTLKDHERGVWAKRFENHEKRKTWDRETTTKGGPKGKRHFPVEVCNGRESRSLKHPHKCVGRGIPGKKGGGPCRHHGGKKA